MIPLMALVRKTTNENLFSAVSSPDYVYKSVRDTVFWARGLN